MNMIPCVYVCVCVDKDVQMYDVRCMMCVCKSTGQSTCAELCTPYGGMYTPSESYCVLTQCQLLISTLPEVQEQNVLEA